MYILYRKFTYKYMSGSSSDYSRPRDLVISILSIIPRSRVVGLSTMIYHTYRYVDNCIIHMRKMSLFSTTIVERILQSFLSSSRSRKIKIPSFLVSILSIKTNRFVLRSLKLFESVLKHFDVPPALLIKRYIPPETLIHFNNFYFYFFSSFPFFFYTFYIFSFLFFFFLCTYI